LGASKTLKSAQARQQSIGDKALSISNESGARANEAFGQRQKLNEAPTNFYTALSSGDPTKMMTAAAVPLANIAKQYQGAKGSIEDSLAPGAAKNFALAQLYRDKGAQNANFLNTAYLSSFPALQGLASDQGQFGLQQQSAQMGGINQASSINTGIMQSEQQRQAAKMNMIGGIAGMAGGAATGGGFGHLFKGAPKATGSGALNV
jgi:hypothetical protein